MGKWFLINEYLELSRNLLSKGSFVNYKNNNYFKELFDDVKTI